MKKLTMPLVTPRQHAAILSALRVCQHGMFKDAFERTDHWDGVGKPLTADEIDTLCEDLN